MDVSVFLVFFSCFLAGSCTNNGFPNNLGKTPPRGWRSWNGFVSNINQVLITAQLSPAAERRFSINSTLTSLADLGYNNFGIDDGWEDCGAGVNGSFHDINGNPLIDKTRFPDMRAMVQTAGKQYNLTMGWYMNCCGCAANEHKLSSPHYEQDARATADLGFTGLKVDGCGNEPNITAWAAALNATGQGIVLENCNDDTPFRPETLPDGSVNCPYNFFRTSIDQAPSFTSTMWNLHETLPYLKYGAPGCYPYPDMLTIGTPVWSTECNCYPNKGCNGTRISFSAAQAQFSAFAVISSPLTLGYDLSNTTEYNTWWPIVSNAEALAINAAWAGEAGRLVLASDATYTGPVPHGALCEVIQTHTMNVWLVLGKKLPGGAFAVVAINGGFNGPVDIDVDITQMGFSAETVLGSHDVWTGQDTGTVTGTWRVRGLAGESAVFQVLKPQ